MSQRSWLQRNVYRLSRVFVRGVGRLLFRLEFYGREHFPWDGAGLVCSNHQSYLDPILAGAMCDRRLNYLARENLFRSKLFGALIRFYDAIPVRRDGMSLAGLKETLRRLKRGELVLIFPEGTRTIDGSILPLKPGFCVLARKAKVPLIPMAIVGAFDVWPKNSKFPKLARIRLAAGPAIGVEQIESLTDEALVALLDCQMRACYKMAASSLDKKEPQE